VRFTVIQLYVIVEGSRLRTTWYPTLRPTGNIGGERISCDTTLRWIECLVMTTPQDNTTYLRVTAELVQLWMVVPSYLQRTDCSYLSPVGSEWNALTNLNFKKVTRKPFTYQRCHRIG